MSWDIYGEPLRRGHCEVHPHVHEEYPCSVCIAERRAYEEAQMAPHAPAADDARDACVAALRWIVQAADSDPFNTVGHVVEHVVPGARAALRAYDERSTS